LLIPTLVLLVLVVIAVGLLPRTQAEG